MSPCPPCMTAQQTFDLARGEMSALYSYIQNGGMLYFESCRRTLRRGNPDADGALEKLVEAMGGQLAEVARGHPLLCKPHLFPQLPDGYEARNGALRMTDGIGKGMVLHSSLDFACLWAGDRGGQAVRRDELRSLFEWGTHLLIFATERQTQI